MAAPRSTAPRLLDATRRILHCPHIVDAILEYATPATRAACLRVSRQFYTPAARALYHTVRISQANMAAFFRGALVGIASEHDELAECDLARGLDKCTIHDPDSREIRAVRADRAGITRAGDEAPSGVNMKAPFLKYVRVLTIAQHHACVCHVYGPHAKTLLPNLDIVRTAPDPVGPEYRGLQKVFVPHALHVARTASRP